MEDPLRPKPAMPGDASAPARFVPARPTDDPAFGPVLEKSPGLRVAIERVRSQGFDIRWGPPGKGTYLVEKGVGRAIVIDQNAGGNGARIAGALSHEIGHVEFREPLDRSTKQAYISGLMRDEAAATIHNAHVRREILGNGGPDIGFAGLNAEQYREITDRMFDGKITRAQALEQIAEVYRTERTSNTRETYEEYYGKSYQPPATGKKQAQRDPESPPLPGSPADPGHPDHHLLEQIRAGVRRIDEGIGKPYDDMSERMSRCLLPECKEAGLRKVDHVVMGGSRIFAVQGGLIDPAHLRAHVPTDQAIRTPVEQSDDRLLAINRSIAGQQERALQQEPAREMGGPARGGPMMR